VKRAHIVITFRQGNKRKATFTDSNINVALCYLTRHDTHLQTYVAYLITFTIKVVKRQKEDTSRLIFLKGIFFKDDVPVSFDQNCLVRLFINSFNVNLSPKYLRKCQMNDSYTSICI